MHKCLWLPVVVPLLMDAARPAVAAGDRRFVFEYTAIVRDIADDSAGKLEVWLPVPPNTPEQRIIDLSFRAPIEGQIKTEPVYGNKIWYAQVSSPTARELRITQRIELIRSEKQTSFDAKVRGNGSEFEPMRPRPEAFLRPDRLVSRSPRFVDIARGAIDGHTDPLARGRALYDYVLDRMIYDKTGAGWGRGDADYACDARRGNCSDFHSFFIALARAAEMPARFWCGFPLPPERGRGQISGYHCWAEFWAPGLGWVPVDVSEASKHPEKSEYYFGGLDENRIVFTLGRDLILRPGQRGEPINFFIYPYVELNGSPWPAVEHEFRYEDLP